MPTSSPRILLIGAGRFGRRHLEELRRLEAEGELVLAGVVVRSEVSRDALRARLDTPVFAGLDVGLLRDVDAVDIVTPAATHAALAETCLAHAHVLVEKPLATDARACSALSRRAAEHDRVLMVGHIYRYHPVVRRLKLMVSALDEPPRAIYGQMINPRADGTERYEANLEFLHLFDIIDFLFAVEPEVCRGVRRNGIHQISLRYPGPIIAVLDLGWAGDRRLRNLRLIYDDREIKCDLADNSLVTTFGSNQFEKDFMPHRPEALRAELQEFLSCLGSASKPATGGKVGARIVDVALRARPRGRPERPRVAIVGGGFFGAAIGIELGRFCDVTIFERHADLMTEASYVNQWRHHGGFHYPRSYVQIQEIRDTRGAFEAEYGDAIMRWYPAFFCTSAYGVEIPADRYLAACAGNDLSYSIEDPPADVVDPSKVSLCLKVDEGVYDFYRLKGIMTERLAVSPNITVALGTEVVDAEIEPDGRKRMTVRRGDETATEAFDYLVNASYANRNIVAKWFGFPIAPLRFHFDELLLLRLPIAQICVSIVDGPFTSLVGIGKEGQFLLSHALDSSHYAVVTEDGLPPEARAGRTNRENILRHAAVYMPILEQAKVMESRFAFRAVPAFGEEFDARPTVVTDHGFGCWSVLGGKILTCVSNARAIRDVILAER